MLLPKAPEGTQDPEGNVHIVVLLPDPDPDDADFPDADFPDADFPDADVDGDRVSHPEAARWEEGNMGTRTTTNAGMIVYDMVRTTSR